MANYSQKESDRLQLGIRFIALAPAMIMPDTALGKSAVDGNARDLGVPAADFVRGMKAPQSPDDVGDAVETLFSRADSRQASGLVGARVLDALLDALIKRWLRLTPAAAQ